MEANTLLLALDLATDIERKLKAAHEDVLQFELTIQVF
jgi:hypothetical protein